MRLIDADAFKEYVGDSVLDADLSIPYNETTVREYLDDMPTINAKPVVYAHWELEFDSKCREIGYHCSICDGDWHRKAVRSITISVQTAGQKWRGETTGKPVGRLNPNGNRIQAAELS